MNDGSGWTALLHAVVQGHADVVSLLLNTKVDPEKVGTTPEALFPDQTNQGIVLEGGRRGGEQCLDGRGTLRP